MKEGAAGFLTKPVQEEQLLAEVSKLIGAAAETRQPAPVE
jgi:FixJ family two-component response regulator